MKRTTKTVSTVLCTALLLCTLSGFVSSAADVSYTAEISGKNIMYGEKMYMAIAVTTNETDFGVATYVSADAKSPIHTSYKVDTDDNGNEFFVTYGISAKEINKSFYYAVVDENGNEISERLEYSAKAYASERLGDEGISEKQAKLYNAILVYGDAADVIFGNK